MSPASGSTSLSVSLTARNHVPFIVTGSFQAKMLLKISKCSTIPTLIRVFIFISLLVEGCRGTVEKGEDRKGIFESLRGYIGELGNVIHDVAEGIEKLGTGIRNVEEFLDATVDEDCIFECPNGGEAEQSPNHPPTSNGCGSFGLEDFLTADVLPLDKMVECCDGHDICYSTCGTDKDMCDLKFKKCLYGKCSAEKHKMGKLQHKGCQAGAKILHTATTALGCKSFMNAQKDSCLCPKNIGEKPIRDEF